MKKYFMTVATVALFAIGFAASDDVSSKSQQTKQQQSEQTGQEQEQETEAEYFPDNSSEAEESSNSNNEMSEGNNQEISSSEERLFRNEDDVYMNFVSQTFVDDSGLKIIFGGNGEMEIDGDYAGIARVKSYNLQRAILRYSGGVYGEGFLILSIEGGKAKLIDPNDPSSVWYRKRTL